MKKLLAIALTVATTFFVNVSTALADTTGPYVPYNHKPIPTGFDDTSIFYIAAMVTFTTGMVMLSTVKRLKAEQSFA